MCGIAGYISLDSNPPDAGLVRRMTSRLIHRGPDGEGFYAGSRIALGHRRLSILDLERGGQPMASASGSSVVAHNGEIYNTPRLRRELEEDGPPLRTRSDTEVVVEGLERRGLAFLDELNGIFAFAWHHEPSGQTLLVRDPFGVKPLYYHRNEARILFASEIRALLADPDLHPGLDRDELTVLLTLRYNPSPGTLLQGVRKLNPGHYLLVHGGRVEERRYDRIPVPEGAGRSFADLAAGYAAELGRAVQGQMLSDVPVGLFLSGGIDSSAVARFMSREAPQTVAFTVGFDEGGGGGFPFDERAAAAETAQALGLEHQTEICGREEFQQVLPEVVRTMEEPVGSASAVPYWMLSRKAARTHKVVLTGQGADEPHGGYPRYQGLLLARLFGRLLPGAAGPLLSRLARGRHEQVRRGLALLGRRDAAAVLLETYRHFSVAQTRALVRPEWIGEEDLSARRIAHWREPVDHFDLLGQMLHVDCRMWLPDDLLLYGDKLSMAHGLEVRVPFLDRGLMRLVEAIPRDRRVALFRPKRLHRAALRGLVPPQVYSRRKLGFQTPVDEWFRTGWLPLAPQWFWGSGSFLPSILRVEAIQQLVHEHRTGRADHQRRLYTLLALEFWGRAFL